MTEQVPELLAALAQLAEVEGVVPDDGSGIDGIWTTTVPAPQRERDWRVAMNADLEEELTVDGWPGDDDQTSVGPGQAVIHLGRWPAGVIGPGGGEVLVEEVDADPQSIEDELIADVDAQIEALQDGDRDE